MCTLAKLKIFELRKGFLYFTFANPPSWPISTYILIINILFLVFIKENMALVSKDPTFLHIYQPNFT